ncbi:hypothetical protein ALC152_03640 [Arcobacter sp. 15-2]|uniref:response regulator n=1 Tax=Arcobacter sp. 15-2 TaxID=3374109 RepID=UPI00399CE7E5
MKKLTQLKFISNRLSVLYIEKNKYLQDKLYNYLQPLFLKIYQSNNGLDGYEKYIQHSPDIIITSLELTTKNAFELIADIHHKNQNVPIIVLSLKDDTFELLESLDNNKLVLIQKPMDLQKLDFLLSKLLLDNFDLKSNGSLEIIKKAFQNKKQISCISNYKGLFLKNHAILVKINENSVFLKITKAQLIAAQYEKQIIILLEAQYILADIAEINAQNSILELINPQIINYQQRDKIYKRIVVDKSFKASLMYDKTQQELIPLDTSYKYIALSSKSILNIEKNSIVELTIGFEINGPISSINEKKFTKIFATGKVIRIDSDGEKQKFVISLDIKKAGQNVFKKYLQEREIDIIQEFNQKLKS